MREINKTALSQIVGLVPNRRTGGYEDDDRIYNSAIDLISQKQLAVTLDREKLAKVLFNYVYPEHDWECRDDYQKKSFYKECDAIISQTAEIITLKVSE